MYRLYVIELRKNENFSLALAGRNKEALASLVSSLHDKDITIEICDITSETSLDELTSKSKIVMNAAGPFTYWGKNVVDSCIQNKVHYLDTVSYTHLMVALPFGISLFAQSGSFPTSV